MSFNANQTLNNFLAAAALVGSAACVLTLPVQAQQVYRIVGADGKVTFSDKPPVDSNAKVTSGSSGGSGGATGASQLPFELRQIVSKYPVTLYTGENCSPCLSARSMLISRGVPFTEKTVKTSEDSQALQRISGESSLPFATVGSQQLKGFSDSEWTQFLNAAGYPTSSVLPASYRQAAATPLVAVAAAPSTTSNPGTSAGNTPLARPVTPTAPAAPPVSNPAGIKF